jgi:hypothetical protein
MSRFFVEQSAGGATEPLSPQRLKSVILEYRFPQRQSGGSMLPPKEKGQPLSQDGWPHYLFQDSLNPRRKS